MSTDRAVDDLKRQAQATASLAFTLEPDGMVAFRMNGEIVETLTVEELMRLANSKSSKNSP